MIKKLLDWVSGVYGNSTGYIVLSHPTCGSLTATKVRT